MQLAYSISLRKNVALKIVNKKKASSTYLHRFLPREIDLIKILRHENIIRHYQLINTSHRLIIAMEYAPNGTVFDLLEKKKRLSENESRDIFSQLIRALVYCHSLGIAHRDLKLENLLLDENFRLKLSDFGFARNVKSDELCMTFCGSSPYASPEILKNVPYDPMQSDVWATGIILFAILFGYLPFDDVSLTVILKKIAGGPIFPEEYSISTEAKETVHQILAPAGKRLKTSEILEIKWMKIVEK